MIPELTYLVWSVVLLIVQIAIQATLSDLDKGLFYALGAQDEQRPTKSVVAKRMERTLANFLQSYPAFVALALTLAVTGTANSGTALGAAIWFWGRVAYVPAYVSGVPGLRTVAWFGSIVGLTLMIWPLLIG